ncbi:uncharacterized protein PV06_07056 [Exophiala oligosperma]|uniref:WIBG Mago-binding domain-containing protein n=2 Tax=Chaetothyriales TaxID=34395 RepID=A0A0D2ANL9_9EURO|nr:uncharacterized protein PV06_07056 [Exophiala oligosperma]KAJ9634750.1 hypothetical protein H2204_006199 [Knufia peltigerae]KIW41506.1 hypothetical protein PV06_07056 [Exophiala oligosperma]
MSKPSKAGIETSADGGSYIPSSKRADGSTRKEIKVRPGYRPPEDIETYKNRSAEAWKNRGPGGVPGADPVASANDQGTAKSKNAKRREAARRKGEGKEGAADVLAAAMQKTNIADTEADRIKQNWRDPSKLQENEPASQESDPQKKIRNQLKKLKAVRELKEKRATGEKLSLDQIMKIGKEGELLRDLRKLGYDGPEVQALTTESSTTDST